MLAHFLVQLVQYGRAMRRELEFACSARAFGSRQLVIGSWLASEALSVADMLAWNLAFYSPIEQRREA